MEDTERLEEIRVGGNTFWRDREIWYLHCGPEASVPVSGIEAKLLSHIETLQQRCASLERVREVAINFNRELTGDGATVKTSWDNWADFDAELRRYEREHPQEPQNDSN